MQIRRAVADTDTVVRTDGARAAAVVPDAAYEELLAGLLRDRHARARGIALEACFGRTPARVTEALARALLDPHVTSRAIAQRHRFGADHAAAAAFYRRAVAEGREPRPLAADPDVALRTTRSASRPGRTWARSRPTCSRPSLGGGRGSIASALIEGNAPDPSLGDRCVSRPRRPR